MRLKPRHHAPPAYDPHRHASYSLEPMSDDAKLHMRKVLDLSHDRASYNQLFWLMGTQRASILGKHEDEIVDWLHKLGFGAILAEHWGRKYAP